MKNEFKIGNLIKCIKTEISINPKYPNEKVVKGEVFRIKDIFYTSDGRFVWCLRLENRSLLGWRPEIFINMDYLFSKKLNSVLEIEE